MQDQEPHDVPGLQGESRWSHLLPLWAHSVLRGLCHTIPALHPVLLESGECAARASGMNCIYIYIYRDTGIGYSNLSTQMS